LPRIVVTRGVGIDSRGPLVLPPCR
jgi:hypothetical protein